MIGSSTLRNQSGATAVEFALILPALLITILASFQLSYIGWAQNRLENAVRQGSRVGITGVAAAGKSRQDMIEEMVDFSMQNVAKATGQPIVYTSRAYPSFSTLNQPGEPFDDANGNGVCDTGEDYYEYDGVDGRATTDISTPGAGSAGDVVRYEITFPLNLFVPIANQFFGSNSQLNLTSRTVVRNELFGASAAVMTKKC
jgi:Flp pilus assembly protein TadG